MCGGMKNARPSAPGLNRNEPMKKLLTGSGSNYQCPVCGEMVDPSKAEQILLHHEHVTHPRDFVLLKKAAA